MMGAVEFGEVFHQAVGRFERARLVQHEAAQEHIEIAQILGRLGLVQQPQRHLVADAQHMPEALCVAGKAIEMRNLLAQTRLELAQIQIEAIQLAGHVEAARRDHVMAAHIGRGIAAAGDPEQANQTDRLAMRVAVFQHQRRPGGALAQVLGGDLARGAVLLIGPGPTHIRHQAAIAPTALGLACGGVEVDNAGRGQQCRHRVQQGRLARPGAADEQEALLRDRHFGQAVERAPVVHLQPPHAELLRALLGKRISEQGRARLRRRQVGLGIHGSLTKTG